MGGNRQEIRRTRCRLHYTRSVVERHRCVVRHGIARRPLVGLTRPRLPSRGNCRASLLLLKPGDRSAGSPTPAYSQSTSRNGSPRRLAGLMLWQNTAGCGATLQTINRCKTDGLCDPDLPCARETQMCLEIQRLVRHGSDSSVCESIVAECPGVTNHATLF